jgi:hypothetical protein
MGRTLFDFSDAAVAAAWYAIDDGVMGGRSQSSLRHDAAGHARFAGAVSLDNGGGFASVRSRPQDLSVSATAAYLIAVRGDGRRYKLALRIDDGFDGVSYQAAFIAPADAFHVVRLPLVGFAATMRGRVAATAAVLAPAKVRQAGLLIADRQAGPFALDIRWLRAE